MSQQTPYLSLTKPTVGGQETSNRWGTDLNYNFDILDAWVGPLPDRIAVIEDRVGVGPEGGLTQAQGDARYVNMTGDAMSGALAINAAVSSVSPTTGAFTVAGGVGVGGNINAAGAVKVSSTTPSTSSTTGALTVAGGVGVGGAFHTGGAAHFNGADAGWSAGFSVGAVLKYSGSATQYGMTLRPVADNTTAVMFMNAAGGTAGTISQNATTTAYNTSSSAELKEDLQSFDAGRIIDDTEVYDFKWKSTRERAYGIIAQQAVEVYPQAITHDEKEDWWGVDYSKYVPVILQELKALRARVAELEGEKAPVAPKKGH